MIQLHDPYLVCWKCGVCDIYLENDGLTKRCYNWSKESKSYNNRKVICYHVADQLDANNVRIGNLNNHEHALKHSETNYMRWLNKSHVCTTTESSYPIVTIHHHFTNTQSNQDRF